MKIRNGFVSNSSSSSFCIYGTCLNIDDLFEKLKESNLISEKKLNKIIEDDGLYEIGEFIEKNSDLEVHISDYDVWLGKSWSTIGDDETGREFKEGVKNKLENLLGSDLALNTYNEEIYNG
jgi:hypothetical protein